MSWSGHIDFERYNDIRHLLADGTLQEHTPAYDVARQAIALGIGSPSNRQHYIYETFIALALERLALVERCPPHR